MTRSARAWLLRAAMPLAALLLLAGCAAAPRNMPAVHSYYGYEFTAAREALRGDAMTRNDEQVLLNTARLGLAALADGDLHEAELALGRTFDLLSTAGLNADRTTAAVLVHEGVRIWKGEPFEQALMYHAVAALYAVMGDWENARAAAANSLFRLTDFGGHQTPEHLARKAAADETFLERGYTAVDTDFTLGFLMQAIGAKLSGAAGADDLFDAAAAMDPSLGPLINTLRFGAYNTLLLVDYGKGPTKVAYGPDNALVRFVQQEPPHIASAPLRVQVRGSTIAEYGPVTNVSAMAMDHRWNNLEDIRRAKSVIGDVLLYGGLIATQVGSSERSAEVALAGVGAMLLGLLTKSGAQADTRYLEYLPQSVYLVPLQLDQPATLSVTVHEHNAVVADVEPGDARSPRVVYLRLHGGGSRQPNWLTARQEIYGNDHSGVARGDCPWILGGMDVSTPSRSTLEAYQANGYLLDFTVNDLIELYRAEGIHIGSGMEIRSDRLRNPSYRHILEGGTGLFTPEPTSVGYKRLMFTRWRAYEPKSERVRNVAAGIRVRHSDGP